MRKSLLLTACALACHCATAQVRTSDDAFPIRPPSVSLPVAPLAFPKQPIAVLPARPEKPMRYFDILATDVNVKTTFLRWADVEKRIVIWNIDNDIPIDAAGSFEAADLAAAMTIVAESFTDKKVPFVIREYDNAIVVMPRWQLRP